MKPETLGALINDAMQIILIGLCLSVFYVTFSIGSEFFRPTCKDGSVAALFTDCEVK